MRWAAHADKVGHLEIARLGVLKEHCVAFAEIRMPFFARLRFSKAVFGASPVARTFEHAGLALCGERVFFRLSKGALAVGPEHVF